jgi:hypothetical protein
VQSQGRGKPSDVLITLSHFLKELGGYTDVDKWGNAQFQAFTRLGREYAVKHRNGCTEKN